MAVDKLVDSTQLDADLTSVANAIRTKGGTSASLEFPADFLTAIAAIPSGGGGSVQYKSGTYTATSDKTSYMTITTVADVGFTPKAFIFVANNRSDLSGAGTVLLCAMYAQSPTGNDYRASIRYTNTSNQIGGAFIGDAFTSSSGTVLYLSNRGEISFHASAAYTVKGGVQFSWYAFDW